MVDALIIDACRTPRGIGKAGKGALSGIHPQRLGATVLRALAVRTGIDTSDVDDIIWGTSSQRGQQSGDLGRMAALDAGYDVRASGRHARSFLRLRHHQRQYGGGLDHVGLGGSRGRRRHGDDVDGRPTRRGAVHDGRRQPASARAASAIASGRVRRCDGDARRHYAAGCRCGWGSRASSGRPMQSKAAISTRASCPSIARTAAWRSTARNIRGPQTTLEGLAGLKPAFTAVADYPLDEKGTTYRDLILQKLSRPRDRLRASRRQFVRRGRWLGRDFCWLRPVTPRHTA